MTHKLYVIIGGTCGVHIQQLKNLVGHSFGPEVAVLHSGHVFGENALFQKQVDCRKEMQL